MRNIIFFLLTICTISYANEGFPPGLPYLVIVPKKPISQQIDAEIPRLVILEKLNEEQYVDLSQMLPQFSNAKTLTVIDCSKDNQIGWLVAPITSDNNPVIFIELQNGLKDISEWKYLNTILEMSSLQFLSVRLMAENQQKDILHLASGLEKTQSLKYFDSEMFDNHHVNEFLEMLAQNKSITNLTISTTNLHHKAKFVAAIANNNTALKMLSLYQCDITTKDKNELLSALSHNITLTQLNLYNNPCNEPAEEKGQIAIATLSCLNINDDPTLDPFYSSLQDRRDEYQNFQKNRIHISEQQQASTNGSCNLL